MSSSFSRWKYFWILVIVVRSHAYAIFDNSKALDAVSSVFPPPTESENIGVVPVEGSGAGSWGDRPTSDIGPTHESFLVANNECSTPGGSLQNRIRGLQLACPNPSSGVTNSHTATVGEDPMTEQDNSLQDWPQTLPEVDLYTPKPFLEPDDQRCADIVRRTRPNAFTTSNTPVCSTGLDKIAYPLVPVKTSVILPHCFPCKSSSQHLL